MEIQAHVDGNTYIFNEESLSEYIRSHLQTKESEQRLLAQRSGLQQELNSLRVKVYECFNDVYNPGDEDITISVTEINEFLESIGADLLQQSWSATVLVSVSITGIQAASRTEVEEIINDAISVDFSSYDGDTHVDEIDIRDVYPE